MISAAKSTVAAPGPTTESKRGTTRSRFLGAAHLRAHQKQRIRQVLEKSALGDETARQIFIVAVEYQLSAFEQALIPRGRRETTPVTAHPEPAADTLTAIAEEARRLLDLLNDLPRESRDQLTHTLAAGDRFGRGYDGRYLHAFGLEIAGLMDACSRTDAEVSQLRSAGLDTSPSREFVAKLADIFSECFELRPTADEDGQFTVVLSVLAEVTGLLIGQDRAFVAGALGGR